MDNPNVSVKNTGRYGKGIFAKSAIKKGEVIASFDGPVYTNRSTKWNNDIYNHAIQFERYKWRDSLGIARSINHSCNPNCGVKNLFSIVAMRDIQKGEEITWDYEMTENHPYWRMRCKCQSRECRKVIGAYDRMSTEVRKRYGSYTSKWLRTKTYVLRKP